MRHVILWVGGGIQVILDKEPTLEYMQGIVNGYIEAVWLPENAVMWVNEEGLLKGLPINTLASALAERVIVGNVVITSVTEEGETAPLPDTWLIS